MVSYGKSTVEGRFLGEFVDHFERPPDPIGRGEPDRPRSVGVFDESDQGIDGLREFTVLLKDGRMAAVRGHELKHDTYPQAGQDVYSVVVRYRPERSIVVALFNSADVSGIFEGRMTVDPVAAS